ncbi:hypothetical protein AU381_00225 [Sinorhizobium glycinis]|uniref:Uncharacterized protein n=1 Tax=Sinorhizobium glycinis TaxID=1472378 RepID=A0A178XYJ7_9HYPH|nr:hypothetical protein [Sinorhizobium glycinis]OAP40388.1 hypothetical protein AU381_00225 [Sinorhizobium glycinis]
MTAVSIGALAASIVNRWAWWQNALKGNFGPMHEGEPQQGFYRTRFKGGKWEPVAIWLDDETGKWVAYRAGREVDPGEAWNFCRTHPITKEAYDGAINGQPFPDEDETVAAQVAASGHNSGEVDRADEIADQIEAALAGMKAYAKIGDDATAAKALSLRNRLNELSREADKKRDELKRPHLEAGKAVDAKWQPLVKKAKAGADQVRDAIGAWETHKLQEERRRQREAEQALLAAEQAQREQQADVAVMEAPAPTVAPVETAPSPIKPTYGKAASVKVVTVVKDVTDWPALAVYMSAHPDMQTLLRQLAQRALDAGRTNIPGITTEEKANVR